MPFINRIQFKAVITVLICAQLFSCRKQDDSLNDPDLSESIYVWTYSIADSGTDTLAIFTPGKPSIRIVHCKRTSQLSPTTFHFYINEDIVSVHATTSYELIYSEASNLPIGSQFGVNYSKEVLQFFDVQNEAEGFRGFYMYHFPYERIDGRKVISYFRKVE